MPTYEPKAIGSDPVIVVNEQRGSWFPIFLSFALGVTSSILAQMILDSWKAQRAAQPPVEE